MDVLVTLRIEPNEMNCHEASGIILATYNSEQHINLYVDGHCECLVPADAKRLRDELNRIYPVEPAAAAKKPTPKGAQAYKGNGKHSWEEVAEDTQRLRVPGGWLYSDKGRVAVTFVPVPEVVGYAV